MPDLRRSLAAIALLVVLAPVAASQRAFDPYEQLDGYKEAYFDDYSSLYDFDSFESRTGKRFSASELAAIAREWTNEKKRVAKKIELIETDPVEGYLFDTDARLRRRKFFKETEVLRVDAHSPFYYYVERPFKRREGYEAEFAALLAPWTNKMAEVFAATYVEPLELERKERFGGVGVVVLASRGRYDDYADGVQAPSMHDSAAHYDPKLRVAVTFRAENSAERAAKEIRRSLLHELVHALQHAHCAEDLPRDTWLTEGMAEYLSYSEGRTPDCLDERPIDRRAVEALAPFTEPQLSPVFLPGIRTLAGFVGYGGVVQHVRRGLRDANIGAIPDEAAIGVHYAHASLLVHFLHHGDDGRYREPFLRYVKASFAGRGGVKGLDEAFEGVDLAELDGKFLRYVRDEYRKLFPNSQLAKLPETISTAPASAAAPAERRAPFDPESLRPPVDSVELALATAVGMAREGEMVAASERLTEWLEKHGTKDDAPRVERELKRLRGFAALRRKLIERHVAEGKKLIIELDEGKLIAVVEGLDGETVRFRSSNRGRTELDLEAVDPVKLADIMRRWDKKHTGSSWLVAYPYVLTGEHEKKRGLFKRNRDSKELEADASGEYPTLRATAAVVAELNALAGDAAVIDGATADGLIERVLALNAASGRAEIVLERSDALKGLARAAFEAQFAARGPTELFEGDVEMLEDGVVQFDYDFVSANDLKDFEVIDGAYPYGGLLTPALPEFSDPFRVKRGAIEAMGLVTIRHRARLVAPSLSYELAFDQPRSRDGYFGVVGLCDDGYGSFAACVNLGTLVVTDKKTGTHVLNETNLDRALLGQKYSVEVVNDGRICRAIVDGVEKSRIPITARPSGSVFLSCATGSTMRIHRLRIRGRFADGVLAELGAAWVEERLTRLGLGG